ncbi:katanin p60 ATPase-containing subunit A-like 2 [Trichonephila clavata]|uniref:Katanin p60 ATPase-containing subunit A-like 2 n=1 Tax=Trichonephila clavata TaxID=2740835 RepID=A0A8X6ILV3_TRICU|nr:katanin p60 ATPase-containing subunit A-like 2 [Trichonephila clavata]
MTHLNIEKISLACRDREKEEQKKNFRKKSLLFLINHYLENNGFIHASEALRNESKLSFSDHMVCDNIDLEFILQDFESYYFLKYQKLPQIIKKLPESRFKQQKHKLQKLRSESRSAVSARENGDAVVSNKMISSYSYAQNGNGECTSNCVELLENHSPEWKAMANLIMQDVCKSYKLLSWNDIVGHDRAKQLLKEAVIYPLKYHQLFPSFSTTWRSILLYGPTGTGKTLLATVSAGESKATFFNVSISTLMSKWRGESEKLVKVLFDLAKLHAPSVVFIDEIDALISHRGCDHEASRRMKTEFFLQMDALASCDKFVLLLGASNMPWELDCAILRRMEKRILISLPDAESRSCLFEKYLSSISVTENIKVNTTLDFKQLAEISENYSASDIELVCKEVKMIFIRQVIENFEKYHDGKNMKSNMNVKSLEMCDVLSALHRIKPASIELVKKYLDWKEKHGSE